MGLVWVRALQTVWAQYQLYYASRGSMVRKILDRTLSVVEAAWGRASGHAW
jgi:hypothetical protein